MNKIILIQALLLYICFSSAGQQDLVLSSYGGTWISKTLGDYEIVITNDGFKLRSMAYPNAWVLFKPTKHPEYVCYQIEGKGPMKNYVGSKITFLKSDKFELNFYGNPYYFEKPKKAVEKKKYSLEDLPLLNGFWKTVSDKVFATPSVFEVVPIKEELKIINTADSNLWAQFRVTTYPEFECYQVSGGKMQTYQGSKITIEDANNMKLTKQGDKETFKLIRTRIYSVNDAGEVFINNKKIAIIKKTSSGSVMNTTVAEFTVYDINNKPYLLSDKTNTKYIFLDDNKSYIPSQTNAQITGDYGIAKFIAGEDLFTPDGFNSNYRADFIEKYNGFDATVKSSRDRTAPIKVTGTNIYQRNEIIGSLVYKGDMSAGWGCEVYDMNKKLVSRMTFSTKDKYNMVSVVIYLGNNSSPEKEYQTMWSVMLVDEAVKWLVEKNHL
jgi:hypothetical protein